MRFYAVKRVGSIFMPILGDRENLRIVRIVLSLYDSEMYTVRCVYDSEKEMKVKRFIKTYKEELMVTKFTKKELSRLGCADEEISLVMKYQKLLPIPDGDFEMNARTLHGFLGVGKKVTTWIQGRIEKYGFKADVDFRMRYESDAPNSGNVDYTCFSQNQLARMGVRKEYYLTVNMCKELCTIENNELGRLARRYFILMEDLIKRNDDWWKVRKPQRLNYKPMCKAVSEAVRKSTGNYGDDSDFSREANILNRIATGCSALEIKLYLGVGINELTRDNLTNDYNDKIAFLQEQNILLLGMGLPIIQRVNMLISFFDIKYPDAKPLQHYFDRDYLLKAREKILEELNCRG